MQENHCFTTEETAKATNLNVSSAHNIFHGQPYYHTVCAQWISQCLTPELKQLEADTCSMLLKKQDQEGEPFLDES
jgi:hypothetical protein